MEQYDKLKLSNQLCFPLYACARRVIGRYTPYLKPLNLTYTQYIVLLVLWEEKEVTVRELCRKLYLDSGTLTPLLKKMEAQGYVVRRRNADDERVVTVKLTDAGEALKENAKEIPGKLSRCISLSEQEMISLYGILYKVLDQIGEDE